MFEMQLDYCRKSEKYIRKLEKELTYSKNNDTLYRLIYALDCLEEYCDYKILSNKNTSVYILKDNCKIKRRKIYIRPFNEEKYSTQFEDTRFVWTSLWKEEVM